MVGAGWNPPSKPDGTTFIESFETSPSIVVLESTKPDWLDEVNGWSSSQHSKRDAFLKVPMAVTFNLVPVAITVLAAAMMPNRRTGLSGNILIEV